jgi:hypothetical protein
MYAEPSATNWDETVSYVLWAYRSLPHSATGYSPYMLAYGQEMRGPTDRLAAYKGKNGTNTSVKEQVVKMARRLQEDRRVARENIPRGKQGQRARHDKRAECRINQDS